jgi:tetratricopeptide (TPR) repeat protein
MIGRRIFFILLFCVFSFCIDKDSVDVFYSNGITAYGEGQYDLAVQEFEAILSFGIASMQLFYNLGNSYYRNGDFSNAIWAYESCLRLSPSHSDAKYNLKLVNLNVIDKIDFPNPPFYLDWYIILEEYFSPTEWINISLFFILLIASISTIYRFSFNKHLKFLRGATLSVFLISLFFTISSIIAFTSTKEGIIIKPIVEVRSEPNNYSTRLFQVHEGLKVEVDKNQNEWLQIELLDGKKGWILNKEIRLIY